MRVPFSFAQSLYDTKKADRIIVLYKGRVFKEFLNTPPVEEAILHHAIQGIT